MKIILSKKKQNKLHAKFHFFPSHIEREKEGRNVLWRMYAGDKPGSYITPNELIRMRII